MFLTTRELFGVPLSAGFLTGPGLSLDNPYTGPQSSGEPYAAVLEANESTYLPPISYDRGSSPSKSRDP